MALATMMIELLSMPDEDGTVIVNYPCISTGAITVVKGLAVQLNSSGEVILGADITKFVGVALNTPTYNGEMVSVLRKGKIRINDVISTGVTGTLVMVGEEIADENDMVYLEPTLGKFSNTRNTAANLLVGYATKIIATTAGASQFEMELNMENSSGQPSA